MLLDYKEFCTEITPTQMFQPQESRTMTKNVPYTPLFRVRHETIKNKNKKTDGCFVQELECQNREGGQREVM